MSWLRIRKPKPKEEPTLEEVSMVQAQGLLDAFKLLDGEAIDKVKAILKAVDVEKVEKLMKMIEFNEEGELKLKIELGVKKV